MTIFHAWTPPGRVNGTTVRPFTRRGLRRTRGSPTSGAPIKSSNGTRYTCASGSSSSKVGRRWPFSSRDRVLFEIPVRSDTSVNVRPRVSFPGGVVRTLVRTPRDTENRGLRIAIEAGSYFASSDVQLDGADAPEIHDFEWTSLPDGDYRVEATLMRAGAREVHAVECFVVVKLDGAARDERGRRTPSVQTTKGCS